MAALDADAEPAAERQRPRLLRDERVGPGLDEEAVDVLGRDRAPRALARLQQRQLEIDVALARQLDAAMRRGQPGDTGTDHDELHGVVSTRSASAPMNAG